MGFGLGGLVDSVVKVGSLGLLDTDFAGEGLADDAMGAANTQAAAQRESLDYLKEKELRPNAYREGAMDIRGAGVGLTVDQEGNLISDGRDPTQIALDSPYYQAMYDAQASAVPLKREALARDANAMGLNRSGNMLSGLADEEAYTLANARANALQASYGNVQGDLNALSGLPSYAPQIAQGTAGIGQTMAQGQMAGINARQQASGQLMSGLTGLAGAFI